MIDTTTVAVITAYGPKRAAAAAAGPIHAQSEWEQALNDPRAQPDICRRVGPNLTGSLAAIVGRYTAQAGIHDDERDNGRDDGRAGRRAGWTTGRWADGRAGRRTGGWEDGRAGGMTDGWAGR